MKIKAITTKVITLDSFANYFNRNSSSHALNLIRWELSGDFPKTNKRRFSAESYPTNKCGLWWIFWELWNAKVSLHLKQSHIPHFFRFSPTQSVEKEFLLEIRAANNMTCKCVLFSCDRKWALDMLYYTIFTSLFQRLDRRKFTKNVFLFASIITPLFLRKRRKCDFVMCQSAT